MDGYFTDASFHPEASPTKVVTTENYPALSFHAYNNCLLQFFHFSLNTFIYSRGLSCPSGDNPIHA